MRNTLAVALVACASTGVAAADCIFDANFEITNPFDPDCGGRILTYTEDDGGGDSIALGYPVPVPVASLTAVDGFRAYESLHAQHQFLMTEHDGVAGHVVGTTVAGRDVWAYVIGDPDTVTVDGLDEPAVLLNGGIHAREWQSPEVVTEIFEQLVERADDGGIGTFLAENLTVVVVPVLNVDGFLQTQRYPATTTADVTQPREGRMRRKNLRQPSSDAPVDEDIATVEDNFFGTDLNRNGSAGFGANGGSLPSPTSLIYHGAAPLGEPELGALLAAADLGPRARLRLYEDIHSFSKVYIAPQTGNGRRDALTRELRTRMRAVTGFSYAFSDDRLGLPIGTTADWFAYELEIPAWTLELEPRTGGGEYGGTGASHSGFILPDAEIARVRDELALTHLLGYYRQAGPPRIVAVEISDAATGEVAYAAEWLPGAERTLDVRANVALLPGVEYRLWLAFDRPMRWRDDTGAIADFPGQDVAPFPVIALEAPALGTEVAIEGDASAWLDAPGGAPSGYLRYRDDALAATFTLPGEFAVADGVPLVLSVAATDLALAGLDADPATPVDWQGGHWVGYENALGIDGDTGGTDCSLQPYAAATDAVPPPDEDARCAAAIPPPPPPPPDPPSGGGGGGGGATDLGALVAALYALGLRRRRGRPASDACATIHR